MGKPMFPKKNATRFVHQCGVVVRNNVPICIQEWNKPKKEGMENVSYVNQRLKELLVNKLLHNFILPVVENDPRETAAIKKKVEQFALKKMAEMFNKYKNRLWKHFETTGEVPVFQGTLEKQKNYWNGFVKYKESDLAKKRSATNKANNALKKYHHKTGGGGYAGCEPKWAAQEKELRRKGLPIVTEFWPRRARNWMLGHCKGYNMETGELILDENNLAPKARIEKAIELVKKGEFVPDRENDELTLALGNHEKTGRARGYGPDYTWFLAFSECNESYRSRERAKKRKEQEEKTRLRAVEESQEELLSIVKNQQLQLDELRGSTGASQQLQLQQDSHRRSSVASTEAGASHDVQMVRYPVDNIREKTPCELHVPIKNLSFKAAEGYALTCEEEARWYSLEIPDGFGRVGVDEILPGYDTLELGIPGPENEKTLGEVKGRLILWKKKYIVFPGSSPRAPSPPGRNSPPPSPYDDDRDEHHISSPMTPPHQRTATPDPTPPAPTKTTKSQKRKRDASIKSTGSQPKSRAVPLPRIPPTPPVRAYDMTDEERQAHVKADVRRQLAPKPKPQKQIFEPETVQWATGFLNHPSQFEINKPDDYTRALRRIDAITHRNCYGAGLPDVTVSGLPKRKGVAQLGEQAKKGISPMKVITDMELARATKDADFAREAGISVSQLHSSQDLPFLAEDTWRWEYGKSLVPKDREKFLGTQMRKLNDWYLKATERGVDAITMLVTEEHFNGEDMIQIYLEELFQLYKMDALDLSIVATYCL